MAPSPVAVTTLPDAYAARLRSSPGDPLVTFYDLATGERVELSATTWVNWAAKVAGLLTDELDLERGSRLLLDVGTHWQASVLLGGAWWAGIEVVPPGATVGDVDAVDAVACAESDAETYADAYAGSDVPVLALSLKPMSGPCGTLPAGVLDFGREVLPMPDAYVPLDPPTAEDVAWRDPAGAGPVLTHADVLARPHDDRVLADDPPGSDRGIDVLGGALAGSGSVVLVRRHGQPVPANLVEQERVTR
ncbi:TIGR03089 family protein [Nocardioidaceae bacterium]|nr:TIGR03089 family protein [Nocardioidaceae bacterium]